MFAAFAALAACPEKGRTRLGAARQHDGWVQGMGRVWFQGPIGFTDVHRIKLSKWRMGIPVSHSRLASDNSVEFDDSSLPARKLAKARIALVGI